MNPTVIQLWPNSFITLRRQQIYEEITLSLDKLSIYFILLWHIIQFNKKHFFPSFHSSRCVHITDIGVGYISTMLSLTALFLRWCSQVRDFGLQHLCSMRNLQVLSLAGCPLLTSSGLSSLIQLRHLQELELTNCPGASHELFDYLKEHLPRCLIIE